MVSTVPLVIHVPHASLHVPSRDRAEFLIPDDALLREASESADLHTGLLARAAWPGAQIIEAEVSRLVVDVERFEEDALELMAGVGRGAVYTHDHQGRRIRPDPSAARRRDLLGRYYHLHWSRLREAASGAVLIDLHSYPASPWPVERGEPGAARPEIDLGFTSGLTPSIWVEALTAHFREHGYETGHNTPYAGVIDAGAHAAVMIEIRRDRVGSPAGGPAWDRLVRVLSGTPVPPSTCFR